MKNKILLITISLLLTAMAASAQIKLVDKLKKKASQVLEGQLEEVIDDFVDDALSTRSMKQEVNLATDLHNFSEVSAQQEQSSNAASVYGWNPMVYSAIPQVAKEPFFSDDFVKNKNKWPEHNTKLKSKISNGVMTIESVTNAVHEISKKIKIPQNNNFEIEAQIEAVNGKLAGSVYLIWGSSSGFAYGMAFDMAGSAFTIDRYSGEYQPYIPWTVCKYIAPQGSINKLTVRKVDESMYFFINEKLVHAMPFENFKGDLLGFIAPPNSLIKVHSLNVTLLKKADLKESITAYVTEKIHDWQKRGKYEKTVDYTKRVNEENRNIQANIYTQEAVNYYASQKMDYSVCTNSYDPDNETFKLIFEGLAPIYVAVPINEAEAFDNSFKQLKYEKVDFTLTQTSDFAVLHMEVTNPGNGKKYIYDSEDVAAFSTAELELNFDPVDVDLDKRKKAVVNSEETKKVVVGKSDVDIDIPVSKNKNTNVYALIIGNEDYNSFQPGLTSEVNVDFAENDARIFKEYVVKTMGVPEKNVSLVINGTYGRMMQEVSKLKAIAKINSKAELIFYYSGHGLPDEVTHDGYIIPVDISGTNVTSGMKVKKLYSDLTESPVVRVTVFLDACFSGGARNQGLVALKGVKVKPADNALNGNLVVFSSSTGDESSGVYREKQHGLFTYFLLQKLKETKGNISYSELSKHVSDKVQLESVLVNNKNQTPQTMGSPKVQSLWHEWKFLKK